MGEREQRKEIILNAVTGIKKTDLEAGKAHKDIPVSIIPFSELKPKVIKNAINSYAQGLNSEDVVVLCDMTLIGKGKKGLIFSTEGFYSWEMNTFRKEAPLSMPVYYEELAEVTSQTSPYMIFKFKDGLREEKVYGGIFTEFITTAMNRILEGLRENAATETVELKKAEPEKGELKTNDELCDEAMAFYKQGNFVESNRIWLSLAEKGFARAQNCIAVSYERGEGLEKDVAAALMWYKKAADQGNEKAMFNLASVYRKGNGVEKNLKEAEKWYRKAADKGHKIAAFRLGEILEERAGDGGDLTEALSFYKLSAELGNDEAAYRCGMIYYHGTNGRPDYQKAREYLEPLAKKDYGNAQYVMALIYGKGLGVQTDQEKAVCYLQKAAANGNEQAKKLIEESKAQETSSENSEMSAQFLYKENDECFFMDPNTFEAFSLPAAAVEKAVGTLTEGDMVLAKFTDNCCVYLEKATSENDKSSDPKELFYISLNYLSDSDCANQEKGFNYVKKSAESGLADAQYLCASCYEAGHGVGKNQEKAVYWYEKAAENGQVDAQVKCGQLYYKKDNNKAFHWYYEAAKKGNAQAQATVGEMFEHGTGVENDFKMARDWYEKAANQGHPQAQIRCSTLYDCKFLPKDKTKARKYLEMAARSDDKGARAMAEILLKNLK